MIERDDLRAAVGAGIVSESQAAALAGLAESRQGRRKSMGPDEEPFELFKGFNEIFIVIGLIILASGWFMISAFAAAFSAQDRGFFVIVITILGLGIVWALSEYFIRKRRMIAPAITLIILGSGCALMGFSIAALGAFMEGAAISEAPTAFRKTISYTALGVAGFVLAHFWRFRVPFALAVLPLFVFVFLVTLIVQPTGIQDLAPDRFFLLQAGNSYGYLTLVFGLILFAWAMYFDTRDPLRVTRLALNGFWLHIIAAPAIVNTVAVTLLAGADTLNILLLSITLIILAIVAIVIDRRSFLIAGAGYSVVIAGFVGQNIGVAYAIILNGIALLLLGAFWERIRAAIMRPFENQHWVRYLPPFYHPEDQRP